jgi:hypothetical protein
MTTTKDSLRLSLPKERSIMSSFTLQNKKKNLLEQSLVNRRMLERLDVVVSKPFLENSNSGDCCLVPVEKTVILYGGCKTDCVSEVLAAFHLL